MPPPSRLPSASKSAPLVVHFSPWKVGAMTLFIAHLSAWWAWRGIDALVRASERTFHLWFTPALGIILTLVLLGGVVALFLGKTQVIVVDETGLTVPDLYEDPVPWRAIGGITLVRGRGVVFEVTDGGSYGRKMTRNLKTSMRPGVPDMACIRSGLLDQSSAAILASMLVHQARKGARTSRS
jgi:hypothetical protein